MREKFCGKLNLFRLYNEHWSVADVPDQTIDKDKSLCSLELELYSRFGGPFIVQHFGRFNCKYWIITHRLPNHITFPAHFNSNFFPQISAIRIPNDIIFLNHSQKSNPEY
jgi:hypothetical protein